MPLYDYKCQNEYCGETFEQLTPQNVSEEKGIVRIECTKCKKKMATKQAGYKFGTHTGGPNSKMRSR